MFYLNRKLLIKHPRGIYPRGLHLYFPVASLRAAVRTALERDKSSSHRAEIRVKKLLGASSASGTGISACSFLRSSTDSATPVQCWNGKVMRMCMLPSS